MKLASSLKVMTAIAALLPASTLLADNRQTVSSRAVSSEVRGVVRGIFAEPRKPRLRPFEKVLLNTAVYRYEGNPTIRHEEFSSPEVMFHVKNRIIRAGHDWDSRH